MPKKPKAEPTFRPANWPPFKPCFHHDFEGEIPRYGFNVSREGYYLWMLVLIGYAWNLICSLSGLGTNIYGGAMGVSAIVSTIWFLCGAPCAYCCWFHNLYNGFREESSLKFGWFFFSLMMQCLQAVYFVIGWPGTGGNCFWIGSLILQDGKTGIGIMYMTNGILWSIVASWSLWLLRKVLKIYRSGNIKSMSEVYTLKTPLTT